MVLRPPIRGEANGGAGTRVLPHQSPAKLLMLPRTSIVIYLSRGDELQEECRGWDVNEIVFSRAMWSVYHLLMRADFTLFDEYDFKHAGEL